MPNSSIMFNYNRKKYRFLTPVKKKNDDSILERPEFMYPDPKNGKDKKTDTAEMVNYLRKPRSEMGSTALFAAAVSPLLQGQYRKPESEKSRPAGDLVN